MTVGINTEAINHKNIPFTMYDLGWVVLCIGAAIGSGIVFFPLQVGLKGVWVFALAVILGYPAVYYMQKLFIETMARSDEQDSYLSIITSYVGSRWGVLLGALYSFTMLKSMVEYALAITNDSASYLKTFGLTNQTLSEHWWWSLLLIAGLSLVASKGEKLLFKVSGSMIAVKLVIIVAIGFVVIPFWDVSNIGAFPTVSHLVVGTFPTLPFAIFSIMFVGILNPMNIAYKKREEDKDVAKYKILRVHKLALGKQGALRITLECHTCYGWLLPVMDEFRKKWSEVEIDILPGFQPDPIGLLLQDRADVAIVDETEQTDLVRYSSLFKYEMVAILANEHPLTRKPWLEAEDFRGESLITYAVPDERIDLCRKVLKPAGIPIRRKTTELTMAIIQQVACQRGIAALPIWAVSEYLEKKYVTAKSITENKLISEVWLATLTENIDKGYVNDFIGFTRQRCLRLLDEI